MLICFNLTLVEVSRTVDSDLTSQSSRISVDEMKYILQKLEQAKNCENHEENILVSLGGSSINLSLD